MLLIKSDVFEDNFHLLKGNLAIFWGFSTLPGLGSGRGDALVGSTGAGIGL